MEDKPKKKKGAGLNRDQFLERMNNGRAKKKQEQLDRLKGKDIEELTAEEVEMRKNEAKDFQYSRQEEFKDKYGLSETESKVLEIELFTVGRQWRDDEIAKFLNISHGTLGSIRHKMRYQNALREENPKMLFKHSRKFADAIIRASLEKKDYQTLIKACQHLGILSQDPSTIIYNVEDSRVSEIKSALQGILDAKKKRDLEL